MASVVLQTSHLIQSISTDMLAIIGAVVVLFFYGLYRGTTKLGTILVSTYVATLLYLFFPYTDKIVLASKLLNHTIWWIVFFALVKVVMDRIVVVPTAFSSIRNWVDLTLLSIAIVASITMILYSVLSFNTFYTPTIIPLSVISSSVNLFWTLVASLLILLGIVFV